MYFEVLNTIYIGGSEIFTIHTYGHGGMCVMADGKFQVGSSGSGD